MRETKFAFDCIFLFVQSEKIQRSYRFTAEIRFKIGGFNIFLEH